MTHRYTYRIGMTIMALWAFFPLESDGMMRRERAMDQAMNSGIAAMEDGLYEIAEGYFKTFIRRAASDIHEAEGTLWLIQSLYHQKRYEEVITLVEENTEVVLNTPMEGPFLFWKARAQFDDNRYEEAAGTLKSIDLERLEPGYGIPAYRLLAHTYMRSGETDEALRFFEEFDERYPESEEAAGNILDWAELLIEQGRESRAQDLLLLLTNRFPESGSAQDARLLMGYLFIDDGHFADAEKILDRLIGREETPSYRAAEAWFAMARIHEEKGELDEAIEAVLKGESANRRPGPLNQGRLLRARLLVRQGHDDDALNLLKTIIRDVPGHQVSAPAQLEIAEILLERGSYEQAAEEFQHYLDAFEDRDGRAQALLGRGWSLLGLQRYSEAAALFEKAYQLHPDDEEKQQALFKVGDALFNNRQFRRAREEYLRLNQVFPGSVLVPRALYQAAECLARLREVENAVKEFQAIQNAYPESPYSGMAALRIGLLKEELGQWDRAITAYDRVMERYPQDDVYMQALHRRGLILYRQGRFSDALDDFERIVQDYSEYEIAEQAFYMRGWCHYLLGRSEHALEVCREFIERFPDSIWAADVFFWLAEYHYNKGEYSVAENRFMELIDQRPGTTMAVEALYWAGRSAMEQQEYLRAIEHFNRLAREYPESPKIPEVRFAQGDALSHLGEFAGAILAFEEITKKYSGHPLADPAYGRRGDCQFILGSEDPARYEEAIVSYKAVLESPTASECLKLQAEFKIGRCKEKQGRMEEAMERYMDVVYTYMDEPRSKGPDCTVWFTRAAFGAASIKESNGQWLEAANILQRVVDAGVPAGSDAERRIENIRRDNEATLQ